MTYRAEYTDRLGLEHQVLFEAASDRQAIEKALSDPMRLELLSRLPGNYLIWDRSPVMTCKWICDGAQDLSQVIVRLKSFIKEVERAKGEGMALASPVDGGYIFLVRPEDQD